MVKKKKPNIFVTHFVGVVGVVIEIVVAAMQFSKVVQRNVICQSQSEGKPSGPHFEYDVQIDY